MPQTKKLSWAELRVGIMATAAIAILVSLIFLLTGKGGLFRKTVQVRTFVDDAASLKEGAPVRLNGIDIGNVNAVRLSGSNDPRRTIVVIMDIGRQYLAQIPADSQAAINPEGVFGDKYVNITRGKSSTPVAQNGELPSLDTREFQEIVNESYNVLASLNGITNRIGGMIDQVQAGKGTIGKLLYDETMYNKFDAVVSEAQTVVNAVASGKGTVGKLLYDEQLYNQATSTMSHVDGLVTDVQSGQGTLGMLLKDPSLYQNANRVVADSQKIVDSINSGQGNLGKLLKDEELYRKVNGTLDKFDTTMDRVNSGNGTIGQLLANRSLYDNVTGLSADTRQLIQDFRKNPKKFLRIKLSLF